MKELQISFNDAAKGSRHQPVTVEVVQPLLDPTYDQQVATRMEGVPFHSRAWLKVINETYGHQPVCVMGKIGDATNALLPVVEVRSWITGTRGVTLPFADYCPPIAADSTAFQAVFERAIAYGRERSWKFLEIRGGRKLFGNAPASVSFCEHTLDLTAGAEKLFGRFEGRMRNAIRKAEKEGIRVEVSTRAEAVALYYELHCETRRKHGAPPQPFSFFENLYNYMIAKQAGIVVLAWHQDVPVAAAVFVHHGSRAVYKFSASNQAYLTLRGNNVVLWEAIRWYANHGFSEMHFGRTSLSNEGLRKYKTGWATQEAKLEYFKYGLAEGRYVTEVDKADGAQGKILGCLPRPLFRLAGRLLYRHLA